MNTSQATSEAANIGASGYIVKPFKAAEILESVGKNLK
jgi:AmiR/NasT family two-component response regulator